ncbi:uncharacterized protein RSE6_10701 [Rhynchosporium secalis]|uniref:Uncharacterized protein n=1 Tax=Rhynchosporium secalis TaxID=38038 RepID=A0A1E1ML46_RHYSE|nr:uncharacterized protein RSE6_10701 [Rhynchosporium secalis]
MGRDIASNSSGYGSPVSTPLLFFGAEDENLNLESSDRPQKRVRIRSENVMRGFDDSAMPPPGIGPGRHLNLVSESGHGLYKPSPRSFPEAPDLRRLSVKSLLSGPPGMTGPRGNPLSLDLPGQNQDLSSDTVTLGID